MKNTIDVPLGITSEIELQSLFSFTPASPPVPHGTTSFVAHSFNQTLQRDMLYGSWADVYAHQGKYYVKITSPTDDVSAYGDLIPAFIKAVQSAVDL